MTALICLTYDDALPVHREIVAPELARRGLRATFFLPAARDDIHVRLEDWRRVAAMGHELGNHSCFHPCRTRPEWDWKPPYRLEEYTRERMREELLLANRILHLVDGRDERSYGATCSDLTCGPGQGESFREDIRDLFTVIRAGQTDQPILGQPGFVVPSFPVDFRRVDQIVPIIERMKDLPDAWLLLIMHGVGEGSHNSFIAEEDHRLLIDWISSQRDWLDSVTVLEAAHRRNLGLI